MTLTVPRPSGLRRDLMLGLTLPLLIIVVATATLGTYAAHRLTERVFDRWLLDAARSVTALLSFDRYGDAQIAIAAQTDAVLLFDDRDRIWYAVLQDGRLLTGRAGLPDHGQRETRYSHGAAFDAVLGDQPVRVARAEVAAGGKPVIVLMAETLIKRERAEREVVNLIWPMGLLVLATAVAIFVVVRRTVRPLEAIAARWSAQSHTSLAPIGLEGVPRELMPFAHALNELLARIRAMLMRERQFAATSAHQIRTPLAGLTLGLARAREAPDLPTARRVIDELSGATQRTARLVQQLLAFGRLDPEARSDLVLLPQDLVELCRDLGAAHMDHAVAQAIDFELIAPDNPVRVPMQRELLAEALSNLIDNAIRYTPAGGRVVVEVDADPAAVRVVDSGSGIPDDERALVFQRFVRGRLATGDGSGLGLAIVRDIADLHGAHVSLATNPWGGTTATLHFVQADA